MISCKSWLARRAPTLGRSRTISDNAATAFHPKVRAFPFAFTKDEAVRKMAFPAAYTGVLGRDIFRAFLATYLPFLGVKPPQPLRVQAVYIPAWAIDAEIEGKAWITSEGDDSPKQHTAIASIISSYVPGTSYEPLSRISLDAPISDLEPIPFPEAVRKMGKQHGSELMCLPFTLSPFALLDAAQDLSAQSSKITENFRIDPPTLKPNLLAVYAVLVPVYLAQYETWLPVHNNGHDWGWKKVPFTVIAEAHKPEGRITIEFVTQQVMKEARSLGIPGAHILTSWFEAVGEPEFVSYPVMSLDTIADISSVSVVGSIGQWRDEATVWAQKLATSKGAWVTYQNRFFPKRAASVDWEDLRIREWTASERKVNQGWVRTGTDAVFVMSLREMLKKYRSATDEVIKEGTSIAEEAAEKEKHQDGANDATPLHTVQELSEIMDENMRTMPQFDNVLEKRWARRPEWYVEWERQHAAKKEE